MPDDLAGRGEGGLRGVDVELTDPGRGLAGATAASDPEALRSYSHLRLALAGHLRALGHALERHGDEPRRGECQALLAKLAEDRFTLAVVGQFGRGKSSLLNALVGRDVLPTGALPLTSAITVLRFGSSEQLVIEREGTSLREVAPLAHLADYVTERGNPGNGKGVATVRVELPVPLLRRGLEFVDTPGIGSAIAANTATTYAFLPACDAVLFVTAADGPFTAAELEFLRDVRHHVGKIFFVVNKVDLLGAGERRDVLDFVTRTLRQHVGTGELRVFPLSCRLALAGPGEPGARAASGLPRLEAALARFLAEEKAPVFLGAVADRAIRVVAHAGVDLELCRQAQALPEAVRRQRLPALHLRLREHAAARGEILRALRQDLLERAQATARAALHAFVVAEQMTLDRQIDRALAACSWQSARATVRRLTRHDQGRFHRRARRWLGSPRPYWSWDEDDRCRQARRQVGDNLTAIPALAAASLGLEGRDRPGDEPLLPWPDLQLDEASTLGAMPGPSPAGLPPWLGILPARAARPWLRGALGRERARALEAFAAAFPGAVADQLAAALDRMREEVDAQAYRIESRVVAAVAGRSGVAGPAREMDDIRRNLLAVRDGIRQLPAFLAPGAGSPALADSAPTVLDGGPDLEDGLAPEDRPAPDRPETDLLDDLRARGCPVCGHLRAFVFRFLSHWQYALSSEGPAQARFAADGGFCPLHLWQLEAVSSPVGLSAGQARLVEGVARSLREAAASPLAERAVRALLRDGETCRVCRLVETAARRYVERLLALLAGPRGREAYAGAHGACLPHLAVIVGSADPETTRFVLAAAARRFAETAEDMRAFVLKSEALRRSLQSEDEAAAPWRAVTRLAGARGLWAPWTARTHE